MTFPDFDKYTEEMTVLVQEVADEIEKHQEDFKQRGLAMHAKICPDGHNGESDCADFFMSMFSSCVRECLNTRKHLREHEHNYKFGNQN